MNYRMMLYIMGRIMQVEALLLLIPMLVAVFYQESVTAFLATILLLAAMGTLMTLHPPKRRSFYAREGFLSVALSWVVLSFCGSLPFFFSGAITSLADCFFETVSGFTTTGASVLTNVEAMGKGLLFWRSFTHWIGGMGVLVFVMAVIPLADDRSMHLMRAEVPGPTVGKLVPKVRQTAAILYGIYLAMSALQVILLLCGGMPFYESLVYTFGTAGTGGFALTSQGLGSYSPYIQWVITIFMVLFGINFNLYYFVLLRRWKDVWKSEELRWYLLIILGAIVLISVDIYPRVGHIHDTVRTAAFQVSSIMTTTGYATADFNLWPEFSRCILVLLMFIGACAGSTAGGIKISRLILLFRMARRDIHRLLHPRSVQALRLEHKNVDGETIRGAITFFILYIVLLLVSILLVSLNGYDFTSNTTAVITCLNNVGPGLGMVGPMGSFASYSWFSKLVLSLDMLFGRLEIFPMILLLSPSTWRRK